jgi:2'-5' RNA ligase
MAQESDLITSLQTFAQSQTGSQTGIPVTLSGFGSFPPKVIFINVLRTFELLAMQTTVALHCRDQLGLGDRYPGRPFMPHMTVAFRDLTAENFQAAWPEFQHRRLDLTNEPDGNYQFVVDRLTLLKHDGQRWQVDRNFPLGVFPA